MRMLWIVLVACLSFVACDESDSLTILAASSTMDAMAEVVDAFSADHEFDIRLVTGGSNQLAQQIRSGSPGEIFVSADAEWTSEFANQKPLLSNRLCLIVPIEASDAPLQRIALADENAPAGRYASQVLPKLELGPVEIIRARNVRGALAWVARNEVDGGIVYMTDAISTDRVRIEREIPLDFHRPITYPAVLLKSTEASEAFFEYLFSPTAREIFESHGFVTIP